MPQINPTFSGTVQPDMCDVMGHMDARTYMAMFDDASITLLQHICGGPLKAEDRVGWADVRCIIDYFHEVPAGTEIVVYSQIEKIGSTSLTVVHELRRKGSTTNRAAARVITVRFDKDRRTATPIEPELRARAEALMRGDATPTD